MWDQRPQGGERILFKTFLSLPFSAANPLSHTKSDLSLSELGLPKTYMWMRILQRDVAQLSHHQQLSGAAHTLEPAMNMHLVVRRTKANSNRPRHK